MTLLTGLLSVIALGCALVLLPTILLQAPKGGGLAEALGGASLDPFGGSSRSAHRFTRVVAGIWVSACLLLSLLV